ncbi:hypothetical protein AGMMS49944_14410 [Spirochaetia bacterium]|nr:hypothetical protein AGMMS49944_14410 [Spirochaetia bacterium]
MVSPAPSRETILPAVMRIPLIQGLPPITPGVRVIRSKRPTGVDTPLWYFSVTMI